MKRIFEKERRFYVERKRCYKYTIIEMFGNEEVERKNRVDL
jgi:hypothetical protein